MKDDEKYSANFSDGLVEELMSDDNDIGNFSEKSEPDDEFVE